MHTTHLRKVGGSIMLTVPPVMMDQLHLKVGSTVDVAVDGARLIVEPHRPLPRRYTLDELLAQCDSFAEPAHEDRAWLDATPAGDELL